MLEKNDSTIVSVIIVNYNGAPFIQKLFESLSKQTLDSSKFEIIFVDNNSNDRSLEIMNEVVIKYPSLNIKIIKNESNIGFCRGNNLGMLYAKGKYLALLNNDMYVDSSYLEELVNVLENDPSIGICGGREILHDNARVRVCLGNPFGIFRIHNKFVGIVRSNDLLEGFFYAGGSSLIIRRELISRMGSLFDADQYLGDLDLSWAARLQGFRVVTDLKAVCHHFYSYATKSVYKRKIDQKYLSYHDTIMTIIKNYSLETLIKRLPLYLFTSMLFSLYESIKFKEPVILGWIKAFFWNLKNLRDTYKKHMKIQAIRKVPDSIVEKYMLPYPAELFFLKLKLRQEN
jgi:GT2 family glycosyltransferase